MKGKIQNISEKLQTIILEKELEISNIIKDVPPIISILENSFLELKLEKTDESAPLKIVHLSCSCQDKKE